MAKNLTTEKDFNLFKKESMRWVGIFGLINWEIIFNKDPAEHNLAECTTIQSAKIATLSLQEDWSDCDQKKDTYTIKKTAFHEVCELLLSKFNALAHDRHCRAEEIEEERHNIIKVLENVLFDGSQ